MKPLISVIVPVYKVEQYLEKCVDSIKNQTYKNLEIILVDDGSPDNCGNICDELAENDSRIKVVHKQNGGLSSARNAGLDIMSGEYVGFVDSDDVIKPEMYEILYERMIKENAQISCCGIGRYRNDMLISCFNSDLTEELTFENREAQFQRILNYRISNSMCDKLFSAYLFDDLRMNEKIIHEDEQLMPYILYKATRVTYTAQPMYCYNMSEGSILRGKYSMKRYDLFTVSLDRIAFYEKHYPELMNIAKAIHYDVCLELIFGSRKSDEWKEKRNELINFIKLPIEECVAKELSKRTRLNIKLLKTNFGLFVMFNRISRIGNFLMMKFPNLYIALKKAKSKIGK